MPITGPDILLYEKKDRIVYITMNRPERMNALNKELFERLTDAWTTFNADDDAWVAIITGAGDRAFSAGRDLKEQADADAAGGSGEPAKKNWPPPMHTLVDRWKPMIAAINGYCLAGGFHVAHLCDLRIAAEHAEFAIPEVRWNVSSPWAADLSRELSMVHLLELLLIGDRISAQRAYEIGFINKVVPMAELMSAATAIAERICENGPVSVRLHKELVHRAYNMSPQQGIALGYHIFNRLYTMEDTLEGPRAFVEKRKPVYKGK